LLEEVPAVIAAYGGQDYPTNAVWRLDALSGLPAAVLAGTAPHSLKRVAAGLGAARLDYSALADNDPFRNANTPEDLAFLRAAAARGERA
jgi:molybdopterin-guanine dinucleotide biosynthesis protein A